MCVCVCVCVCVIKSSGWTCLGNGRISSRIRVTNSSLLFVSLIYMYIYVYCVCIYVYVYTYKSGCVTVTPLYRKHY